MEEDKDAEARESQRGLLELADTSGVRAAADESGTGMQAVGEAPDKCEEQKN